MASIWGTIGSVAGGLLGSIIAPGIGTAAGASIGGALGGLADGKSSAPHFDDPNAWQRDYASRELLTSDIGAKQAAATAGQEMNFARDQAEDISNNPSLAGNAAAQAGARNKLLLSAQRGAQSAYLQGAEVDSANKARGAQIAGDSSRIAQSNFAMNQGYADRPSFSQQLLQAGASTAAGLGLSQLTKSPQPGDNGSDAGDQSDVGTNTPVGQAASGPSGFSLGNTSVPSIYGNQTRFSDPSNSGYRGGFEGFDNSSGFPGDSINNYKVSLNYDGQ